MQPKICPFRKILTDKFVGIFNGAFLPRAVTVSEIDGCAEFPCNVFVMCKFAAVVSHNSVDVVFVRTEKSHHSLGALFRLFPVRQRFISKKFEERSQMVRMALF